MEVVAGWLKAPPWPCPTWSGLGFHYEDLERCDDLGDDDHDNEVVVDDDTGIHEDYVHQNHEDLKDHGDGNSNMMMMTIWGAIWYIDDDADGDDDDNDDDDDDNNYANDDDDDDAGTLEIWCQW